MFFFLFSEDKTEVKNGVQDEMKVDKQCNCTRKDLLDNFSRKLTRQSLSLVSVSVNSYATILSLFIAAGY